MSVPEGFLICDPPLRPPGFIVTRRAMTASEVDRLKRIWKFTAETPSGYVAPIQRDFRFDALPGEPRQWPGAEFCAA